MWWQLLLNGLWQSSSLGLLAAAVALYLGLARAYTFMVAAGFVLGAYAALIVAGQGAGMLLSSASGMLVGAASFIVGEVALFGPLRRARRSSLAELVASIGVYLIVVNLLAIAFSYELKMPIRGPRDTVNIVGGSLTTVQAASMVALVMMLLALFVWVYSSRQGLLIRAIADSPEYAEVLGVPMRFHTLFCVIIIGGITGLLGAIHCWDVGVTPDSGMRPFLLAAVASILGGRAGVIGAACGAVVLSLVSVFAVGVLPGTWADSVAFSALLFVLLTRSLALGRGN